MSLFRQGNLAKYYVIVRAWLCDAAAKLHYDTQSESYLHMLGMYSVEPRMFVCSDFAEYVFVMEKMLQEICKKLSHVQSAMQKNYMHNS